MKKDIEEKYHHTDHAHCWEQDKPQCGQKIEHYKCCLCEKLNPKITTLTDKVREEGWKEGFEYARLTDFGEGNIGEVKKFLEEKGYKHLAKALTNNH